MDTASSSLAPGKQSLLKLWPLLLPVLLLLPGSAGFPYPSPDALYSDLAVSHYPNALYLKYALSHWGQLPLWSPAILSGYPFAANPLAGLWYLPGWLALLFPLPFGFNLLVVFHLLWGGVGLYRLLISRSFSHPAALFGAFAFVSLPKLFAHYGAGHLSLLYAVPWTPWLLLAAIHRSSSLQPSRFIQPGLFLAVIFLADVRWAAFAGLLWLAFEIAHRQMSLLGLFAQLLKQVVLAALLSAPLAFPLLEYARLSTRAALSPTEAFTLSLDPVCLLGAVFPNLCRTHEWVLYTGGVVAALSLLTLLWTQSRRSARFWLWVAAISLLYSLGQYIPFLSSLANLPGFSLLRVPPRALFLTGLAFSVLAAHGMQALLAGPPESQLRRARLALTALGAFALVSALMSLAIKELPAAVFFAGGLALLAAVVVLLLYFQALFSKTVLIGLLFTIAILDFAVADSSLFHTRPASQVLAEGQDAAQYLASLPGPYRVYSPSYSLPQQTAAFYHLELADGVDPLQLESYAAFMALASGVPRVGYSVTLPPFADEQAGLDAANQPFIPDLDLLAELNVRYIASQFDLSLDGLLFLAQFDHTRIYQVQQATPRLWQLSSSGSLSAAPQLDLWTPNRIVVSSLGPGRLLLSELAYPGWRARVDGQPVEIITTGHGLRSVELAPGPHQIEFVFHPVSLYLGLAISVLTLLLMAFLPPRLITSHQ
ncbi:MAG: YfhO family protein [Anaerolineae bacterium]|nr:YfhO family protein [Anaerolineae bacterium]